MSSSTILNGSLTHLCRVDSSTLTLWTGPFPVKGLSGKFLLLPWFTEIPVLYAKSIDPDQTPWSVASDLGLYCLHMSLLWDTRLKWVKGKETNICFSAMLHLFYLLNFWFSSILTLNQNAHTCPRILFVSF